MMSFKYLLLFVFALDAITCDGVEDTLNVPEEALLPCDELLAEFGYPPEIHYVTTKDGYILQLYNIPGDKTKPLLLAHGVFDTGCGWFLRGNRSLGEMAVKAGYDLWVMNFRGNRYSRNHTTLDPNKDMKFWDYSAHEYGFYDLSVTIDDILAKTGQTQLSIVAFSEGSTSFFVLASMQPEYNKKVKIFVPLAPVAYMEHVRPFLSTIINLSPLIDFFLPQSVQEISGYHSMQRVVVNVLCSQLSIGYELCYQGGINSVSGPDSNGIERDFFKFLLGYFPDGTSRKNLIHFSKIGLRKSFSQYDYGADKNLKMYHSFKPPVYNVSKVTSDTVAVSCENDIVSTLKDVQKLLGVMPKVVGHKVVPGCNHLDHMWGKDAPETTYEFVLGVLKQYN